VSDSIVVSDSAEQMNIMMAETSTEESGDNTDCGDSVAMFIMIGFVDSEQARSSVCWYKSPMENQGILII